MGKPGSGLGGPAQRQGAWPVLHSRSGVRSSSEEETNQQATSVEMIRSRSTRSLEERLPLYIQAPSTQKADLRTLLCRNSEGTAAVREARSNPESVPQGAPGKDGLWPLGAQTATDIDVEGNSITAPAEQRPNLQGGEGSPGTQQVSGRCMPGLYHTQDKAAWVGSGYRQEARMSQWCGHNPQGHW